MASRGPAEVIQIQVAIDPLFSLVAQGSLRPWPTAGLRILVHPVAMPGPEMLQLLEAQRRKLERFALTWEMVPGTVPYLAIVSEPGRGDASPRATAQRALDAAQAVILALLARTER